MKRVLSIILSLSLMFSLLSGCTASSDNTSSSVGVEDTISSTDESLADNEDVVAYDNKDIEDEENEENEENEEIEEIVENEEAYESLLVEDNSLSKEDNEPQTDNREINWEPDIKFTGLSDEKLLPYIEDTVYSQLIGDLDSTDFFIEDVTAVYVSQEYLQELAYNSQTNVFFGYSLKDLNEYFEGTRYVFTLGDDGQTTVETLKVVEDDTYDQLIKNVAIGTGVILVCVTVSAVSAGAGAPAVAMIFAVAAKTGTTCALSGAVISGVTAAAVKGYQTGDLKEALKAGALSASEGYKWGAISGALTGGAGEAWGLYRATGNGLTMNEVATIQKESKYPLELIKQFKSYKEYEVYKNAGLYTKMVNGKLALVRDIDLEYVSELPTGEKVTNLVRMQKGYAPIDPVTGKAYQLHHINQNPNGTLAILTEAEHQGNSAILNLFGKESEIDRATFGKIRKEFWQKYVADIIKGAKI